MTATPGHTAVAAVDGLLRRAVAAAEVPGAVAAVGGPDGTEARWVVGQADTTPGQERPMTGDTPFDLASLTKIVATTTLVLGLVGEGRLALGDSVGRWLPGAGGGQGEALTVEALLTHASGLPATVRLWEACSDAGEARAAVRAAAPVVPAGTRVVYSDVGFLLLGQLIEAVVGCPLDVAFADRVADPLGLTATRYSPLPAGSEAAATEPGDDGRPWVDVVHDENARFLGGVAGQAGLFSTAADLARFARWWAGPADGPVPAGLRRAAERCRTTGLPELSRPAPEMEARRGLGWVVRGDRFDNLEGWPPGAVGHTGFTGTSLAVDPASGRWVVLLTNAVHYGRGKDGILALRRAVHAALAPPPA